MTATGRLPDGFGRSLAAGAILAGAYWLAAVVGLRWAAVGGAGSSVMPAAGVAMAGLLLGGARLWPAVVVGRLLAAWAVGSAQPLWADAAIAGGNALAAVSQAWLLRRRARLDPSLAAVRDVLRLALGAASGAAVSALAGTGALWLATGFGAGRAAVVGATWWLGNVVGALTVAPLVLAWRPRDARVMPARAWGHLAAVLASVAFVSYFVFLAPPTPYLRTWYALPVLVWAALAFQVRGAAAALAVVSAASIWGATTGAGPFAALADGAVERVFFAQQFAAVASFTVLILAAAGAERRAALAGLGATVAARTAALRDSEARFRAMAEATPALLFEADARGRNLYVTPRFVDYTGLPPAELLGDGWLRVLHPDDRARAAAAWAAAVRDGTP